MIRTGELLMEIEAEKAGRKIGSQAGSISARKQAAKDASLSKRQADDAVALGGETRFGAISFVISSQTFGAEPRLCAASMTRPRVRVRGARGRRSGIARLLRFWRGRCARCSWR